MIIKQLLPLTYHAQKAVVQDDDLNIYAALHNGTQFLDGHLYTSVANNGYHRAVLCTVFGAYGCGQRKAHGA
jgi:hypothetical protein